MNALLISIGKLITFFSKAANVGSGSTWPGHIALNVNKNFIRDILKNSKTKIVLIAGTNGKTTTAKLIQEILEKNDNSVFRNAAGANLLNGIASTLILHCNRVGKLKYDFGIFEVDENTLPLALNELTPNYIIFLNIFRDQLDRYGETDTIAKKWQKALSQLSDKTTLILNADDPQIAFLGTKAQATVQFFGLNDKSLHQKSPQHAVDSTYCPNCKSKLVYETVYFSHLGEWNCDNCGNRRPKIDQDTALQYPLPGVYNRYNTLAAVLLSRILNVDGKVINSALHEFKPAFGRQEELSVDGKKIKIFLSKNPTSFNESLRTIASLSAKNILFVLNDRIPDGRDVSWIWDTDIESYIDQFEIATVSGDRAYDMALRLKYALEPQSAKRKAQNYNAKFKIYENLEAGIKHSLNYISVGETLYILPTYSAMLDVRKILIGKKLL